MARDFFNNLPNTTTPLTAPRLNGLLDGDEAMGNIVVDSIRSKNILLNQAVSKTESGITWTVNNDGTITANGTATATAILFVKEYPYYLEAGQYMLSGCPTGGSSSTYKLDILNASGDPLSADYGSGTAINLSNSLTSRGVRIVIYSGVNANNLKFKPMIEKGTTATDFAPYKALGYVSGNNANGNYIKYDDGTLIQWNSLIVNDQAINSHYGDSVLYTGTRIVIFPIPFIDTNYSAFCGEFHWGTSASWGVVYNKNRANWMTLMIYDFYTRDSGTNTSVSWTAIGKWK